MRYIHHRADKICDYVGSLNLAVTMCDFENKFPPFIVNKNAISEMLVKSKSLWGTALPYFLVAAKNPETTPLALKEAVKNIESAQEADRFALVAYQDSGIISISGVRLPFQHSAKEARWWAPYEIASRSLK